MKKTTLQWISLALVLLMSLGAVVSCSKDELPADTETTDTQAPTDSETEAPADTTPPATDEKPSTGEENKEPSGSNVTPKKVYGSRAGIRLIGPRATIDKDRIYLDFMGSGFEIAIKSKDGKVNFVASGSGAFRIWVDGVEWKNTDGGLLHTLEKSQFIQLTGLTVGDHVIRVIKADSSATHATIGSVVFDGSILDTLPASTQTKYVEFVGDESLMAVEDVTTGFAYLTAQQLNAEYMITAWKGADVATGETTVKSQYGYVNPYASKENKNYNFEKKADAVVLSVGQTDTCDALTFEAGYASLVREIIRKNGAGTKIYCVLDAAHPYKTAIQNAAESLGGENSGVYVVEWTGADEAAYATQLSTKIEATIDLTTAPIDYSGVGTVVSWESGKKVDPIPSDDDQPSGGGDDTPPSGGGDDTPPSGGGDDNPPSGSDYDQLSEIGTIVPWESGKEADPA